MSEDRLVELDAEVAERRREVEERLARLRTAFASEVGIAPRRRGWLLAILAGAAGVALAMRRQRRRRSDGEQAGRRRKRRRKR